MSLLKKILEKQETLDEKLESGEISKSRYDHENLVKLGREKAEFSKLRDLELSGLLMTILEIRLLKPILPPR